MNALQRFCREAVTWKHLRHPNILPLLGVTVGEHQLAMVSEWMENGNINEFIQKDEHVNRTELVRCHLTPQEPYRCTVWQLVGVANGLMYMHDLRIVHGDLKGV
jgi:serine/threonine protein kinase